MTILLALALGLTIMITSLAQDLWLGDLALAQDLDLTMTTPLALAPALDLIISINQQHNCQNRNF